MFGRDRKKGRLLLDIHKSGLVFLSWPDNADLVIAADVVVVGWVGPAPKSTV